MAARCSILALAVLLTLLARPSACRVPDLLRYGATGNDACSTCKFAAHVVSDLLCDPMVDDTMVNWMVQYLCPQMPDAEECSDLVKGLTPALVEWLRVNANPEAMCGSMHVCGAEMLQSNHLQIDAKPVKANRPNDMTCPLCMFVAAKVKERINDPTLQEDIRAASLAACAQLPEGVMQDACVGFVNAYEMMFVKYLADMEPEEVCMMIGTCLDTALARLQAQHGVPLLQLTPANLAPIANLKQAVDSRMAAGPRNDHCETCKVVVMELHQLAANPEIQAQLIDYAKAACDVFQSFATTCKADVDQYSPMVFGMIMAYLQPEQVCVQLKMCPPPGLFSYFSMQANLLGSKLASFSIISTSTTSHDGLDAESTYTNIIRGNRASNVEAVPVTKVKVHGPGLALPMPS